MSWNLKCNRLARCHHLRFGDLALNSVRVYRKLALKSTAHKHCLLDIREENIVAAARREIANNNILGTKHHGYGLSDRERGG